MLKYRKYINGDKEAILELFKLSFGKIMDSKYWDWRYINNILNKIMICLATDNEIVIAHYALSPTQLYIEGKEVNSGLSMTTMTHPNYRGLGLFTNLAKKLYQENQNDLDVIYGIPNDNSLKGFIKYLDFNHIKDIPVFEIDLMKKDIEILTEDNNVFQVTKFDFIFDELFEKAKQKYSIILSRTSGYLDWRFFSNPANKYTVLALGDMNSISGYIIMKEFVSSDIKSGDIVDILALNEDTFLKLIYKSISFFKENNIQSIKLWLNDLEYVRKLKEIGFYENYEKFHFIVKNNSEKGLYSIEDYTKWYITMSDIDIF